jgi:hypothetical protein
MNLHRLGALALAGVMTSSAFGVILWNNQGVGAIPQLDAVATSWSGVAAPAGGMWSEVQHNEPDRTLSNTVAGFSGHFVSAVTNFRLADNFTIGGNPWSITSVNVYGYQTGAGTVNPISSARLRIWNGRPGDAGVSMVFDGSAGVSFSSTDMIETSAGARNIFRAFNTVAPPPGTAPGTTRRVWQWSLNAGGVTLGPGSYWVDYDVTATNLGSVFFPSTTHHGTRGVAGANARQWQNTLWADATDTGNPAGSPIVAQDMPFLIDGRVVPEPGTMAVFGIGLAALLARRRRKA